MRAVAVAALLGALALAPSRAHAYLDASRFEAPAVEGGAGGRFFTGAPADGYGCSVCHRGGAAPALAIEGIPGEGWDPGATYELTIAMPEGVRSAGAAIEIADEVGLGVGALAVIPEAELTDADRCRDGLIATAPVSLAGRLVARAQVCGAEQVRVRWTAPPTARDGVRVHAAMVAGNDSGDPSGDGASVIAVPLRARGAPEVEGARLSPRCSAGWGGRPSFAMVGLLVALAWVLRRRLRPAHRGGGRSGARAPSMVRRTLAALAGPVVLALGSCGSEPDHAQPEGWADTIALPQPIDRDPDPRTIEIDLVARETSLELVAGMPSDLWGYDGSVPGPHIEARVGDRLIVHFRNELPEATTIHWHGVRVPNAMDGAPGHTQPAIEPGATFDYDFVLPDEGLYWFHPHQRSAAQVAAGLYGTILVRADDEPEMDEAVLVLSDVAIDDDDGTLLPPDSGGNLASLFGREGNHVLVNGRERPVIRARNGVPLRLRIVNAAIARYFQLSLVRHRFTVIGGDAGLLREPRELSALLIVPGQRSDVILVPRGRAGETLWIRWVPYDRGYGSIELRDEEDVLGIELEGEPVVARAPEMPARTVEPISLEGAIAFDVELTQESVDGALRMGFDGVPSWEAAPVLAHVGETQVWTLRNTMDWAHPIHLHGYFFQALDDSGRPVPEWIDTIDVPVDGVRRFVVRYDDRPGMWMLHCHVLDHADAGMMGMIQVGDAAHLH